MTPGQSHRSREVTWLDLSTQDPYYETPKVQPYSGMTEFQNREYFYAAGTAEEGVAKIVQLH